MSFCNTSCCGRGLFMTLICERVHGSFYCNSVGLGQLEGKLRWKRCQGVSTAAVLRQTWSQLSSSGSYSGSSSETPMIPMAYSFEPIQVALQRLPVMNLAWVRLQPAAMHLQTILPPSNHLSLPIDKREEGLETWTRTWSSSIGFVLGGGIAFDLIRVSLVCIVAM